MLCASSPHYKPRPEQIHLASRIALALVDGTRRFVAEAPCGTGKTFAYLVPLLFHHLMTGTPILISTAGIALQRQLVETDIPLLVNKICAWPGLQPSGKEGLVTAPSYALLKSVGNYVCIKKVRKTLASAGLKGGFLSMGTDTGVATAEEFGEDWTKSVALLFPLNNDLARWVLLRSHGDREKAPRHTDDEWQTLATTSDECTGLECKDAHVCSFMKARKKALQSDVLVTNHQYLASTALGDEISPIWKKDGKVRLLVLDEAHEYPAIARDIQGFSLHKNTVKKKLRYPNTAGYVSQTIAAQAEAAYAQLVADFQNLFLDRTARLLSPDEKLALSRAFDDMRTNYNRLQAAEESGGTTLVREPLKQDEDPFQRRLAAYRAKAKYLDGTCLTEVDTGNGEVFHGVSLEVELPPEPSLVIAVSATLRHDGQYTSWLEQVSCPPNKSAYLPETRTYTTPSPFRWPEQCLAVVPRYALDPSKDKEAYIQYLQEMCVKTARRARGRTMVLCSSWTHVNAVAAALQLLPYRLLVQGQQGKQELVQAFKEDINSVLVGTTSFWTGVDVQGEALSALVIDKLPFRTQDSPANQILKLRESKSYFGKVVLPEATTLFAQGFGRLIRATTDRGVAVLLDQRLQTKFYGRSFYAALPDDLTYTDDLDDIGPFLDRDRPLSMGPDDDL